MIDDLEDECRLLVVEILTLINAKDRNCGVVMSALLHSGAGAMAFSAMSDEQIDVMCARFAFGLPVLTRQIRADETLRATTH